ncbi:MAG: hypothetical protein PHX21_13100 [bacterium]|nr:hypothetical protein [bacterium]
MKSHDIKVSIFINKGNITSDAIIAVDKRSWRFSNGNAKTVTMETKDKAVISEVIRVLRKHKLIKGEIEL